jgi:phosphoribosyl-AMP cyclohydrolase
MDFITFATALADKQSWRKARPSRRFDANGLVTAVVTDADDGTLLMVAHMNAEALALTLKPASPTTGRARARRCGRRARRPETSSTSVEMRVDCDQDAVWLKVEVVGATMQPATPAGVPVSTGRSEMKDGSVFLAHDGSAPAFDPASVYLRR